MGLTGLSKVLAGLHSFLEAVEEILFFSPVPAARGCTFLNW